MNRGFRYILLLLAMSLCGSICSYAAGITVDVQMPRGKQSISVGDVFYIIIRAENTSGTIEGAYNVPGADIIYDIPFSNDASSYFQTTLTVVAEQPGKYRFGPVKSGKYKSNTVSYTINGAGSSQTTTQQQQSQSPDPNSSDDPKFIGKGDSNLFLRATISDSDPYEQEALTYTVKLYTTYERVRFIGATSAPSFEGFTVEEKMIDDANFKFEDYNGKTYKSVVIAQYVLFPQITGKKTITGNKYTIAVDGVDYYNDPYYQRIVVTRQQQLNVTPNDLQVEVRALPTPRPQNFSGGVGKFSIQSSMPSTNLTTNQPATIEYTVTGQGNLKYVKMPDLTSLYPKSIEVFEPTADVQSKLEGGTVQGTVKFDYSITPTEAGEYTIPDIEFVYFNPETGQYESTVAKGYTVHVVKGEASEKSQTRSKLELVDKLLPVGKLSNAHTPIVRSLQYWLFYVVMVVALLLVLWLYRRRLKELGDLAFLRSKKAGSVARKRLKKAAAFMRHGDSEQFYTEMLHATWGFLSDRLHIPQSELNRDNIRQALLDAGCTPQQNEELVRLLDDCEFAKYASASASGDMKSIYERGANLINTFANTINARKTEQL